MISPPGRKYRLGFILNTTIGNMTRYLNLRKYAERIEGVECYWAPVNHYVGPSSRGAIGQHMPDALYVRASVMRQSWPVLRRFGELDGVMIHLFEADVVSAASRPFWPDLLRVSSTDDAPVIDPANYPLYPYQMDRAPWRKNLRLRIDLWKARRTDYFIPVSDWVAGILVDGCGVSPSKVRPIHVGVDLETWGYHPPENDRVVPRILFVGGDFERKGGRQLLDVFSAAFANSAELHIVSKQAPDDVPPNVHVYRHFEPNDGQLARLYAHCDLVVVPTLADTGPLWVFLEALATGRPVIGTLTGANAEVVIDGQTGFSMPVGDSAALASALRTLIVNPSLRHELGARGRRLVEQRYDSSVNVPRIIEAMTAQVDAHRRVAGARREQGPSSDPLH